MLGSHITNKDLEPSVEALTVLLSSFKKLSPKEKEEELEKEVANAWKTKIPCIYEDKDKTASTSENKEKSPSTLENKEDKTPGTTANK